MTTLRWLLTIPLALLAFIATAPAQASAIRDEAGLFSPQAVAQAQSRLDKLESSTRIPVVIETLKAIPGLTKESSEDERKRTINRLAEQRDKEIHDEGIYVLITQRERLISNVLIRKRLASVLPETKRDAIRDAFIHEFEKKDFDGGLLLAVQTIEGALKGATTTGRNAHSAPVVAPGARVGRAGGGGGSTMMTILLIAGGIFVVFMILRVLGGLFNRSAGPGYPNQAAGMGMPRPGMGPGGGPGYYGGGGYGGRGGGGFFSGLLGGLGGAMAGNWLYDQMSGRHGGSTTSAGAGYVPDDASAGIPDQGDDAIIGADDDGGRGASWDDGGGADTGGGGDWGGGGGDWGGGDGGGDWGGGGGGGDW